MASTVTELLRRRFGGKKEEQDNYIYYSVYVSTNNVSRNLWSGTNGVGKIQEMWMDDVQITPVASMTFTTAGTYQMKVLLKDPTTIPNGALNAGHYRNAILPACATSIGTYAFRNYWADNSSSVLTCKAETPPTLSGDPFENRHAITIYVPADSVTAYQTAWSMMTNIQAII